MKFVKSLIITMVIQTIVLELAVVVIVTSHYQVTSTANMYLWILTGIIWLISTPLNIVTYIRSRGNYD